MGLGATLPLVVQCNQVLTSSYKVRGRQSPLVSTSQETRMASISAEARCNIEDSGFSQHTRRRKDFVLRDRPLGQDMSFAVRPPHQTCRGKGHSYCLNELYNIGFRYFRPRCGGKLCGPNRFHEDCSTKAPSQRCYSTDLFKICLFLKLHACILQTV